LIQGTFELARVSQREPRMNKTKTRTNKTLRLNPETLRVLKPSQTAGGYVRRDSDCDTCAERGC
jgi:hypothetical protein